jgi:hypothetical protein
MNAGTHFRGNLFRACQRAFDERTKQGVCELVVGPKVVIEIHVVEVVILGLEEGEPGRYGESFEEKVSDKI